MPRSATLLFPLAAALGLPPAEAQTVPAPEVVITGEIAEDGFGFAVAAAGDVNDDGAMDYLASAPGDDDVAEGSGEVYLFYGPLVGDLEAADADAKITGEAIVDGFGNALSSAGDVNDDGFDDLVIGARSNDTAGIQAGRAYVFLGPLAGQLEALDADAIISGEEFDELGWSVAPAGDVDGDGFDDV
ncbi:MAG: integrin alpha, partial [Thermoanaerobaculia bacterium]